MTLVHVHVGMPKTGTSILQNCVAHGFRQGSFAGEICYPVTGRERGIAHHRLARSVISRDEDFKPRLLEEIERHTTQIKPTARVLISSEGFTKLLGTRAISKLLHFTGALRERFSVRPVLVVREFASFLELMYLQSARFGHLSVTFEIYVLARRRWVQDLMAGIGALRESCGDDLVLVMQEPGFDNLTFFESLLSLDAGAISRYAPLIPPTSKPSLKMQIALTFLSDVESRLGFPLDRRLLTKLGPDIEFDNDLADYTLYRPGEYEELWGEFVNLARNVGFGNYASAFGGAKSRFRESARLDVRLLSDRDYARLTELRSQIVKE